ncbi:hypothetical protein BD779DRAFT_1739314 [Infundibulicybe gibba]|nr:hypothetical protein BD779DRAFT_1739314 [Infundibulicybe gibba]
MCLGQNSAHHAVHYLNSQLGSLYENSVECVKHAGSGLKPLERVRYDFALAEFHVGAKQRTKFALKDDMMFSAVFGKPRLEFICNHEAILYLRSRKVISTARLRRRTRPLLSPIVSPLHEHSSRNVKLHDVEVAFRVDFDVQGIRGHTTKIGNGSHVIQLMVLDFHSARLISRVNAGDREGLQFYMRRYFDYLHHAGHHVLFSLPDFDDDRLDIIIDYSLESHVGHTLDTEIHEVFGVSVEEINRSLSSKWLKAIMDAADGAKRSSICLAEYRSTWTAIGERSDVQFHIKFGAPRVRVLCEREAVLYFKIDELLVYEGHDFTVTPKHTYSDWELAVVVDLTRKIEGSFKRIEIDMTTLRFCEHFSIFHGFDVVLDFAATLKTTIVEFIDYYAAVLESIHFHEIHVIDISRPLTTPDIGASSSDEDGTLWDSDDCGRTVGRREEIIKKTRTGHYDFIQVVSEQSIIEHFKVLWQLSRDSTSEHSKLLGKWCYSDDFKASFGALKIRYLSGEKAIVWIQLDEGTLKPLKGSTQFGFSDWSIAFEVKLKMVDHTEHSKSWFTRFKESFAWKHHGSEEHRTLKHLILDFTTCEFVYELSKFEGLHLASRSAVESVKGAVHYLKDHYFRELTQHGHHILQTIPVWKCGSTPRPQHYDVALILLGMTGFRPLPSGRLEYSTEWFVKNRKTVTHGTVCLSKKVFLEQRLLALLSRVNATTTIVPFFPRSESGGFVTLFDGHEGSEWGLALTTWARHSRKQSMAVIGNCSVALKATISGTTLTSGATNTKGLSGISIMALTPLLFPGRVKNHLRLPTTANHGSLDIVMTGEIDIVLGFKGACACWESKAVAKWSVTLSMVSPPGGSGLTIEVKGDTKPKFEISRVHGDANLEQLIDLKVLHELVVVDLDDLVTELRQLFSGVWEHCFPGMQAYSLSNPVFNSCGDILFDLRPYVPPSQVTILPVKPRAPRVPSRSSVSTTLIDATPSRPTGLKPTKSILRRIGEGIVHAVEDAFDGHSDDEAKEKSSVSAALVSTAEITNRVVAPTINLTKHTTMTPITSTQPDTPTTAVEKPTKADVKAVGKVNGHGNGVTIADPKLKVF